MLSTKTWAQGAFGFLRKTAFLLGGVMIDCKKKRAGNRLDKIPKRKLHVNQLFTIRPSFGYRGCPDIQEASELAKNTKQGATSEGCPARPMGVSFPKCHTSCKLNVDGVRGVQMGPGAMVLTQKIISICFKSSVSKFSFSQSSGAVLIKILRIFCAISQFPQTMMTIAGLHEPIEVFLSFTFN